LRDAIIFLKSKDPRETPHDRMTRGLEDLSAYLGEYVDFEKILYGAWPNYRDHIAHTLRVMLLGDSIIRDTFGFHKVATPLGDKLIVSPEEKEAMWIIMALTHDLGVPLEAIRKISDSVRRMLYKFGVVSVEELTSGYFSQFADLSDFVIRFISSDVLQQNGEKGKEKENKSDAYVLHMQAKYYQKFLSALSSFDHGVLSSIILMKNLVYFKESDFTMDVFKPLAAEDARQFLIRNQIVRAIASHSCEDIYHLGITNFPFMLTVCDEMQEWGRPRLIDVTKRVGSETELFINKIQHNLVDYSIRFYLPNEPKPSEEEVKIASGEVEQYFEKKTTKWLNVLRSAVSLDRLDRPIRDIELRFTVDNEIDEANIKKYVLRHENPEKVEIDASPDMKKKILTWEA